MKPEQLLALGIAIALMFIITFPYTTTETFVEKTPINVAVIKSTEIIDASSWFGLINTRTAKVILKNNDTVVGSITANFLYSDGQQTLSKSTTERFNAGEEKILSVDIPTNSNITQVNYIQSTKDIPVTKEVTRQVSIIQFLAAAISMGVLKL
jgi:hypothetical protein